jgi:hypothetical protein
MIGGMFAVGIRMAAQGRLDELEEWTVMDWMGNGADYSGAIPHQMYLFNALNLLTKGGAAEAAGMSTMSRYSRKPAVSILGPSAGTLDNLIGVGQIPFSEDGWTEGEIRQMRRISLWNNLPYFNYPASKLEEKILESQP